MSAIEIDSVKDVEVLEDINPAKMPWLGMDYQNPNESKRSVVPSVIVGKLIGLENSSNTPLITYPGQSGKEAITARTVIDLQGIHVGLAVTLMFENADPSKPIIMGIINELQTSPTNTFSGKVEVKADGQNYVISAQQQIVLECGKASITLTKAGKILIRGAYISSRSSGAHRIKGGSVQIN